MQAGQTLEIRGVNGSILATASPDGTARVTADKNGNNSPESSVTFEVVTHSGGVTICAMYPDVSGEPDNECVPGGGQMTVRDNDVVVTFDVQVPEGVGLIEWTVNGNVTLRVPAGIDASVDATTVNGTMNSDFLLANPAPGHWTGTLGTGGSLLGLSTVNGNLELRSVP